MPASEAIMNTIVNIDGVLGPDSPQCHPVSVFHGQSAQIIQKRWPTPNDHSWQLLLGCGGSLPPFLPFRQRARSHPSAICVAAVPSESVSSSAAKQLAKQTLAEGKLHKARVSKLQIRLRQYKEMRWVDLLPEYGMCVSGRHHHIFLSLRAG